MDEYAMTIDGERVAGSRYFEVMNPATGKPFAQAPDCTPAELDAAVDAAARAGKSWSREIEQRKSGLVKCADALGAKIAELAPILTKEQGKPLPAATGELQYTVAWFQFTAGLELPLEVVQDDDHVRVEVRRRPHGVVAAICPWNFPVLLAVWKIAPALLAGNTVVVKPSPFTPLSSLMLGEILADALPPGVLNVVSGGDDLGARMTAHPGIHKIAFTGSVATGKKVAAAAAADLKSVTLELGGNDPAIVLDDVDVGALAEPLFWGAFQNNGQVCCAVKRLYVHERVAPHLAEALTAIARSVKVGDGMQPETQLGPINNKPQFRRVNELVDDARLAGARFLTGGKPLGGDGYFFAPTLLTGVAEGTRIVDEEQFGPALPIMTFKDVDEAIERANKSHYGLAGSVWSADTARATEIAQRLECGTVWVNQHIAITPAAPFGGTKWSGVGVENGRWGLLGFTDIQTVSVAKQ